jgi:O-antigen/teichoic acid export membrane protein
VEPAPRRHLAGGALSTATAQAATIGAATIASVVLARVVGPSGNGTVALAGSLTNIVAQVFALGLSTGVTYIISSGRWAPQAAQRTVQLCGLLMAAAGIAVASALYAVAGDALLEGMERSVLTAAVVAVPFVISWTLSVAVALAQDRYELYGAMFMLQAVAMLVGIAALVGPYGAEGAVWAITGSHVLTAVAALVLVRRGSAPDPPGAGANARVRLRETLRFGLQTWVAELLALVAYRFDLFILNAYASTASVGVYSVAVSVTALAWVLPSSLQAVLVPRAAQLSAASAGAEEGDVLAKRAVRHTLILLAPTAAILALLLIVVIPLLYGDRFEETVTLGLLLLPGALALALTKVLTGVIIGRGFPRYSMITTLIVTPATVAAYFVLIEAEQAVGAALATTGSYAASAVLSLYFFLRVTKLPVLSLLPRREDLGAYSQAAGALGAYARDRLPGGRG